LKRHADNAKLREDIEAIAPSRREGRPGAQGAKGNRGQKGDYICAWAVDVEGYRIIPIFNDDSEGPAINLWSLFEKYNNDTEEADAVTEGEALVLERARIELQAVRVAKGLPPK
jgi:hypothetical protein